MINRNQYRSLFLGGIKSCVSFFQNRDDNANQFLQIDLGTMYLITGVATQGQPSNDFWVTKFKLSYSADGATSWKSYSEDNVNKVQYSLVYKKLPFWI